MTEQIRCVLEKALITSTARCRHARSFELGERLGYECRSETCEKKCRDWLQHLRGHARFLFRGNHQSGQPLTNHQEIRLQCGGLIGLAAIADENPQKPIADISSLLNGLCSKNGSVEDIPLQRVVTAIAAYDPRPHRKRGKR